MPTPEHADAPLSGAADKMAELRREKAALVTALKEIKTLADTRSLSPAARFEIYSIAHEATKGL